MNTENNKIIAEFMGWKLGHPDLFELRWGNDWFKGRDKKTNKGYLFFDSDWNWLMEVVEKIETKKYYKKEIQFSITKYSIKIQTLTSENGIVISPCIFSLWDTYGGNEKLQAVYNACVEFIKWYNEQKKV